MCRAALSATGSAATASYSAPWNRRKSISPTVARRLHFQPSAGVTSRCADGTADVRRESRTRSHRRVEDYEEEKDRPTAKVEVKE
ncbi:hypothetical protein HPP92_025423 [Vanilla planifolia]|uniref:Uncharacterized protein n=1 Tax=Vanilla planifolia TaxID=51239 RepID=A0A835PJ60_VANPL|nr:hypothetical protein HPP92_025423 [Vanilla planifolia]